MSWRLLGTLVLTCGCGAKVVVGDAEDTGGEGGAGGVDPGYECILGACGDSCVKCAGEDGADCFVGECTQDGICVPHGSGLQCAR